MTYVLVNVLKMVMLGNLTRGRCEKG